MTPLIALITMLIVLQFIYFMSKVGAARAKHDIKAPAITGNEEFERNFRVHQNTLEQLPLILVPMWLCAHYTSVNVAAVAGVLFIVGRFIFAAKYVADPESRGTGMGVGFLGIVVSSLAALWGIVSTLLG